MLILLLLLGWVDEAKGRGQWKRTILDLLSRQRGLPSIVVDLVNGLCLGGQISRQHLL